MDFSVDLVVLGPIISVEDMNYWTTDTVDLFLVLNVLVESATIHGWIEDRRMVHKCATDSH